MCWVWGKTGLAERRSFRPPAATRAARLPPAALPRGLQVSILQFTGDTD